MEINIADSWKNQLSSEFKQPYFTNLIHFIDQEYEQEICYPPKKEIFAAFRHCSFEQLKVVIIGQDPYHGPNQANGLCFSVDDGHAFPPSLSNIFKEIKRDLELDVSSSGNLERWANQGVLLLNSTLTVRKAQPGSHQGQGWEQFTDAVIESISSCKENIVFLLWGTFAKKKGARVDRSKHCILASGHPSPMSANRGHWFGNQHFSKTNDYLLATGQEPIVW